MKKISVLFLIFGFLFAGINSALSAENFDSPELNSIETPEQTEQETPQKKKFFSILEKNTDSDAEKKEKTSKKQEKEPAQTATAESQQPTTSVQVDSDIIEYFPDRHEFEAIGNAKVFFPEQNSTMTADKIIFNHDSNYIKAYDNIVITRDREQITGDYVHINLNEDNALITEPVMEHMNIQIRAKSGNINKAKVEAMEGTAKFTDSQTFKLAVRSPYSFDTPMLEEGFDRSYFIKEKYNNEWNLKAKVIIIDSYKDRDIVTLEKSDVFLKDLKIGSTGKIKIYTNKEQDYIETNMVEFGGRRNLGAFIAPSYVFRLPFASTLKLGPMVNYDDSEIGFGGFGRFQNAYNRTDFGYSTARQDFVMRGRHQFTKHVWAEYASNAYMNEWWMGGRMPEYGAQLIFEPDAVKSEDLRLTFAQRYSAGLFKDWSETRNFSTTRFRWQTMTSKGLYSYRNSDAKFGFDVGLSVQSTVSLYGTGDTFGVISAGPYIRSQYRGWQQYLAYFLGGEAGDSPFWFDKYFYGKSRIQLGESLRINKYLSVMYSAMIALSDTPNDKTFQENRFYVVIGPDDFKVLLGYDLFRHNTTFGINMAVGTDNSTVEFQKLILNDPENFGKSKKKEKEKPVEEKKESDPMNRSVKDYDDYNPGYGILNNLIQPGIRPSGY